MASEETPPETVVETQVPEAEAEAPPVEVEVEVEVEKSVEAPVPEVKTPETAPAINYVALVEVVLRFLLFASAVAGVVVIVTSKETKHSRAAKFNYSPPLIYLVAALSSAGLYSIVTSLLSFYALLKPAGGCSSSFSKVSSHFVIIIDVLLLGIVGGATGCAGAIAYTGLKGNSHLGWGKVCDVYDKFCTYIGASVAISLFASLLLALLVILSLYSLSNKKIVAK